MKAQVIRSAWIRRSENRGRQTFRRGAIIEVTKAEYDLGIRQGDLRPADEAGQALPPPNYDAVETRATTPAGEPIEGTTAGETVVQPEEWKPAKTHAQADEKAAELGITFPEGTTVATKNEALLQVIEARKSGEPAPSLEDLSEIPDEELVQRAIDYGHAESETVELSHDELVLFVAEAMNRQESDPERQAARTAELAERRAALDAEE